MTRGPGGAASDAAVADVNSERLQTVPQAAQSMGVARSTLTRWIGQGAPVARRGGRGRGNVTLVDVEAISAWRRSQGAEDVLTVLAAELPTLTADAAYTAFCTLDCPDKRRMAGAFAAVWYATTTAVLDRVRVEVSDVPELETLPEKIERLRAIFSDSCTLAEPGYGDPVDVGPA